MPVVKYDDLSQAFDFVSVAAPFEHQAFISLDTGNIYWTTETGALEDEEVPDDLDTSDRYIALPHKNDLDLGRNLVMRFTEARLPGRYSAVAAFFRRRGAYARFKELLESEGHLEEWYAFEAECTRRALEEWCAEHGVEAIGNSGEQTQDDAL